MNIDINRLEMKNPVYTANGGIDVEINHPKLGWIPFTANPDDCEEYGRKIFAKVKSRDDVKAYVPVLPTTAELAAEARVHRNLLLARSDWSQLPDVSEETQRAWQPYRQALRDITDQSGFPENINWPEMNNDNN